MTTEQKFHAPCPHGATGPFCGQCYEEGPYATIAALRAELDAARAREAKLREAARALRIDANRLCDRNLGGTYEDDCRRSIAALDAALVEGLR